jgi:hypothetical protein
MKKAFAWLLREENVQVVSYSALGIVYGGSFVSENFFPKLTVRLFSSSGSLTDLDEALVLREWNKLKCEDMTLEIYPVREESHFQSCGNVVRVV